MTKLKLPTGKGCFLETQNGLRIIGKFKTGFEFLDGKLKMYCIKVSGSCIAGFCSIVYILLKYNILLKYLVWYISDKNQTKRARIIKGWFKYVTDCKNCPDHLIYSSRKMAASRSLSPRIPGVTL
jgi:hypothetical protein